MTRKINYSAIIAVTAIVILIFLLFKKDGPKYDWYETNKIKSDEPYGYDLFYNALNENYQLKTVYSDALTEIDTTTKHSTLFVLNAFLPDDSLSIQYLLNYTKSGNTIILASPYSPAQVISRLLPEETQPIQFQTRLDSFVTLNYANRLALYQKTFHFAFRRLNDTVPNLWNYFRSDYFDRKLATYGFKSYARFEDGEVAICYQTYGKGKIIIVCNPILYSNYFFAQEQGFEHTNNLLCLIETGKLFWYTYRASQSGSPGYTTNNPLRYFLNQKSLKTAWYVFLVAVLLYLIFRSKREQRIIPILPIAKNTSVEFIKTSALLYYKSPGHHHIAKEMQTIFLADIRNKYNIATDTDEQTLVETLSRKSGISRTELTSIFSLFKYVMTKGVATNEDLIQLHTLIENYHKAKK